MKVSEMTDSKTPLISKEDAIRKGATIQLLEEVWRDSLKNECKPPVFKPTKDPDVVKEPNVFEVPRIIEEPHGRPHIHKGGQAIKDSILTDDENPGKDDDKRLRRKLVDRDGLPKSNQQFSIA